MVGWDNPKESKGRVHGEIFSWILVLSLYAIGVLYKHSSFPSGLRSAIQEWPNGGLNIKREHDKEKRMAKKRNGSDSVKESRISRDGSAVLEYVFPFQGKVGPGIPWQWHPSESLQPGFQQK